MTATLLELNPALVWKHFDAIRQIPRGSGNEAACADYVLSVAERLGCTARRDDVGNVVIDVPATPGRENAPIVVLQGHLDMVNEKNSDTEHDFERDPIDAFVDGDWVRARGTTLGSDNGIGVAMSLAIADDPDLEHGPLELLFTIDEETGMTGALGLKGDFLRGRRMINLDTEEENAIYIGCAGGVDVLIDLPIQRTAQSAGRVAREISISGLRGGHSGCDIHEQRGNANELMARVLRHAADAVSLEIGDLRGGKLRNAIPREATAIVTVDPGDLDTLTATVEAQAAQIRSELARVEPDVAIEVSEVAFPPDATVLDEASRDRALLLLTSLPNGVQAMSLAVPGLVETSTNLATVRLEGDELAVGMLSRGSIKSSLDAFNAGLHSIAKLAGARSREEGEYPGWSPDPDAELLKTAIRVHEDVVGVAPECKAIHAGLECGVIGKACPGIQMISVGPRIEGAHSPDECVQISSVDASHRYLRALIEALSK